LAVALGVGRLVPPAGLELPRRLPPHLSSRGTGSGPFGKAPCPLGGLGFQHRLGLPQPRQPASLGGQRGGQLIPACLAVLDVLALVGLGSLAEDLGDLGVQPVQGAVGLVGAVASQLGTVHGDHADLHHTGRGAQP